MKEQNLRQFKPGESGNPGGRPKMPDDLKAAKTADKIAFDRALSKVARMTTDELKRLLSDPTATMLELVVARVMAEAVKRGSPHHAQFLIERIAGKVQDSIHIESEHQVSHSAILALIRDVQAKNALEVEAGSTLNES